MRFANGTIFHGKRQGSGLLSGQGTFTFNDGTSYTGDIINGRRHGYGHLKTNRTADTAAYIGTWSTGVREVFWSSAARRAMLHEVKKYRPAEILPEQKIPVLHVAVY